MLIGDRYKWTCKRHNLPHQAHELTFTCYKNRYFLGKQRTCRWLVESIEHTRKKYDYALWAYVFMPNHVHLLIYPRRDVYSISDILKSIKQPVAQKAINWLKNNNPGGLKHMEAGKQVKQYHFWQKGGGYDRNITETDTLIKVISYIHRNPFRKGLVDSPEQWIYSSFNVWNNMSNDPMDIDRDDWPCY